MLLGLAFKVAFVFAVVVLLLAPLITWLERKQSAVMQDRIGANRADLGGASLLGLFHPLADVVKLLTKEDVVPRGANRVLHLVAPVLAVVPTLIAFAVIPYGSSYQFGDTRVNLVVADIDWGVLYIFAVASLSTYGVMLAGWSSNNNWSLLGAVRGGAQMISYEVTAGLTLVPLFMIYGTLKLTDMAAAQDTTFALERLVALVGLDAVTFDLEWLRVPAWGIFLQPISFVLFLTCIMAENRRPPFDLPEAESELVAGYFTEYSGMRFGLFYMAEFIQVIVVAGLVTTIFLGGWSVPYLSQATITGWIAPHFGEQVAALLCMLIHMASFFSKLFFAIWLQLLIRWSLPRFRYDQLMNLCWKRILPLSLVLIFATAAVLIVLGETDAA